jgi:hypothetical protein
MTAPIRKLTIDVSQIPGWGVDADPLNDPTYPMRDITGDDKGGLNWPRPPLQGARVEVLHSNERPNLTAVFGTTVPPSGFSGFIRRQAFKKSEGKWGHWLLLLMADRINVVEGLLHDLVHLRFPHVLREMGVRAEWQHNRAGFFRKALYVLVVVALLGLAILAIATDGFENFS